MPEQIRCPSCNATLRVPDSLLGKNVKCPKCQTTFTAATDAPQEPDEGIANAPAPAARRRPAPPPEEREEEAPPDDYEDEDRPRRRRKRGRRSAIAESAVAGPAIAMMVIAGLDLAYSLVDVILRIAGISMFAFLIPKAGANQPQQANIFAGAAVGIPSDLIGAAFAVLILVGAMKMKNLSNYGLAMTACIISMLPCHSCCCLGLPFGIWGLVMLNKPEVKQSFS